MSLDSFTVTTTDRNQLIEITHHIESIVRKRGYQDGILLIYTVHTTAGITINENADPDVMRDMTTFLSRMIPRDAGFRHLEGNSDSHLKSSLVGASEQLIVSGGKPLLGTWQGVYFCEFDGPRTRTVYVKFVQG